jgi:hypothetical protein
MRKQLSAALSFCSVAASLTFVAAIVVMLAAVIFVRGFDPTLFLAYVAWTSGIGIVCAYGSVLAEGR